MINESYLAIAFVCDVHHSNGSVLLVTFGVVDILCQSLRKCLFFVRKCRSATVQDDSRCVACVHLSSSNPVWSVAVNQSRTFANLHVAHFQRWLLCFFFRLAHQTAKQILSTTTTPTEIDFRHAHTRHILIPLLKSRYEIGTILFRHFIFHVMMMILNMIYIRTKWAFKPATNSSVCFIVQKQRQQQRQRAT